MYQSAASWFPLTSMHRDLRLSVRCLLSISVSIIIAIHASNLVFYVRSDERLESTISESHIFVLL